MSYTPGTKLSHTATHRATVLTGDNVMVTLGLGVGQMMKLADWIILADGSAKIAFAAAGDADLDNSVDILDASAFVTSGTFNTDTRADWGTGDYTYDGLSDILDVAEFIGSGLYDAGNYLPAGSAQAASLDPTSLAFAALASTDSTPSPKKKVLRSL